MACTKSVNQIFVATGDGFRPFAGPRYLVKSAVIISVISRRSGVLERSCVILMSSLAKVRPMLSSSSEVKDHLRKNMPGLRKDRCAVQPTRTQQWCVSSVMGRLPSEQAD